MNDNIECLGQGHILNNSRCYEQWPFYPCSSSQDKFCWNPAGTEALFSPLGDIGYTAGVTVAEVEDLIGRILNTHRLSPEEKKKQIRYIQTWLTSIYPPSSAVLQTYDKLPRYTNINELERQVEDVCRQVKDKATGAYRWVCDNVFALPELSPELQRTALINALERKGGRRRKRTKGRRRKKTKTRRKKKENKAEKKILIFI